MTDTPRPDRTDRVAAVGSPSSNYDVTLDLNDTGRDTPLVGTMLALENPMGAGSELAIGTVTEVTTRNRWHEDPNMRGAIAADGALEGFSGNYGDTRSATIRLQAAWRKDTPTDDWKPSGPSLRMSPATGTPVRLVDGSVIDQLTAGMSDLHYMGHLGGTDAVPLPLSIPDFASSAGAWHGAVYGQSGSGKAISLDTPIPTPSGWTLMGDLKDGDTVFDEAGNPCRVVKAHDVLLGRECYEVVFSDGSRIVADAEHLWLTETAYSRARQSLERTGARKRNPLLPAGVRAELRRVASQSSPTDVISMFEIEKLTGLDRSSSILMTAARAAGPAGRNVQVHSYTYSGNSADRTRILEVWPASPVLENLAVALRSRRNGEAAGTALLEARAKTADDAWLSMPDIARILSRPTRNAALRATLQSLPVASQRRPMTVNAGTPNATIYRTGPEVTVYPKATILRYIADHCEALRGDQRHKWTEPESAVVTTREILETLRVPGARDAANHAIKVTGALQLPEANLPIDPYLLGVWLGDGFSHDGVFCGVDHEIAEILEAAGLASSARVPSGDRNPDYREWRVAGLRSALRANGLLKLKGDKASCKHIPEAYLRGSIAQRQALLAGLLDTDGTASPNGGVHFDNTNLRLAEQARELALSLGYRATMTSKIATLNGKDCGLTYRVAWTTSDPVFRLTRKLEALNERTERFNPDKNNRRYIVDVVKVESVPVRCITVDSESHLYLAGESMIPTHNTQIVSYLLANLMRHRELGHIVVDPQGQWASENEMAFSVQGFAAELGRPVKVRRISEHLRLSKDATLFATLLGKTRFLPEITKMSEETQSLVLDEIAKIVRDTDAWEDADSTTLMGSVFGTLIDPNAKYISRIYADETRQERLRDAIQDILVNDKRLAEVQRFFNPIHNLFQATNPIGGTRHSLWSEITAVFDKPAGAAAPLLILDMSSKSAPGMDDEAAMAAAALYEVLENDSVKAAVLRNLFATLKRAAEDQFRNGRNLNTQVVLDEAWRYAPNPVGTDDKEIAELSRELAGYARDTRKFGIGWLYISQSTRSVNMNIWDQMTVRVFGYGLSGQDVDKMAEIVDDKSSLRLYRGFANPRSTGRYPFLLTGPVSPLSANATPIVLNAYTSFQDFRDDNEAWIKRERDILGQPLASGQPVAPKGSAAAPRPRIDRKATANPVKAIIETNTAIVANRATVGTKDAAGFSGPLDALDDTPTPF